MAVPFLELISAFIFLVYVVETYLEYRQWLSFKTSKLPAELKDVVSEEKFKKSKDYGMAKIQFGVISSAFELAHTLLVFYYGAIPWLWGYSLTLLQRVGFGAEYEITHAFLFMMIQYLYTTLIHMPFSLYRTFVLEERFGFNKQTLKDYFVDMLKGFGIALALGTPIFYAAIYLISAGGEYGWIYIWVFTLFMTFFLMTIYPNFIAPLFNKYTELEEGELKTAVNALAAHHRFPLTKLYVVDGSRRSAHSNAYMYGFFNNKRIVIFDTLIKQLDTKGIVAVLAHELGHWKLWHTVKNMVVMQAYLLLFFFVFGQSLHNKDMFSSFGFHKERPVFIGLLLFSFIYGPVDHVFTLAMNSVSRKFEYEADEFAVEQGMNLSEPLIAIHVENLGNLCPDPWYSTYHHSHPSLLERIRAMREHQNKVQKKAK